VTEIDNSGITKMYPEFTFIFAMMVAFFYSMMAELLGLSSIVGAFIAGVSLEGIGLKHSKDYREGAEYLHIIFASIFFVSLGILADLRALDSGTLWFLIVLTTVAILTKLIGCAFPAKIQGMSTEDSLIVGLGMTPRGEVAMIVALIGLNRGIIGQDIYVSLVLMSLLTTIIPPIIMRNWIRKN
jgi:Kef-type K+ transport system membrane component KefB